MSLALARPAGLGAFSLGSMFKPPTDHQIEPPRVQWRLFSRQRFAVSPADPGQYQSERCLALRKTSRECLRTSRASLSRSLDRTDVVSSVELRRLVGKPDYFVQVAVADLIAYEIFRSSRVMTICSVGRVHPRIPMKNIKGPATGL